MKKTLSLFTAAATIIVFNCKAQNAKETFNNIIEEDRTSIEALVLYPEETRNAILEACLYPEVITKLENIQSKTRESFIEIIGDRPEEEQQKIYDLVRYNGLVQKLAEGRRKTEEEIHEILKDYPDEIHDEALELGRRQHKLLQHIAELNKLANHSSENILSQYPEKTREAYRHLLLFPEVLEILSDNMKLTVTVGDLYRREPDWVKTKLDSLNREVTKETAEEATEWKRKLKENPELLQAYTDAAEEYAKEKGFDESEYKKERTETGTVNYHYYYSYPFWFGYPYWYPYAYWYQWPYWYDWGYYYGPGGAIVLTGLPSYYFTYWYFDNSENHYYRPRLSSTFLSHYEDNPRSATGISAGVSDWIIDNRENLPSNLLNDDGRRVERFREFGLFESEYQQRAARRPGLTREKYLANNKRQFENLSSPGLRIPDALERDTEGEARRAPEREQYRQRVEPKENFDDIYRSREQEKRGRPERPDPIQTVPPREKSLPPVGRERRIEPRIQTERSPQVEPRREITPKTRPEPTPGTQPPAPRESPAPRRQAPSPEPARAPSIRTTHPSNMQQIDTAREYHSRNWRRK